VGYIYFLEHPPNLSKELRLVICIKFTYEFALVTWRSFCEQQKMNASAKKKAPVSRGAYRGLGD